MFILYDDSFKKIQLPEGFIPLDIFISSIGRERRSSRIEGGNRRINYGSDYKERTVKLYAVIESKDTEGYRLLRDEVYGFFGSRDTFYVAETYRPGKVYKVAFDEPFIPERLDTNQRHAEITIEGVSIDLPYGRSIMKSDEIATPYNLIPENLKDGFMSGDGTIDGSDEVKDFYKYSEEFISVVPDSKLTADTKDGTLFVYEYDAVYKLIKEYGLYNNNNKTTLSSTTRFIRFSMIKTIEPIVIHYETMYDSMFKGGINSNDDKWGFGMGLISDRNSTAYIRKVSNLEKFKIYNPGNIPQHHPYECDLAIGISEIESTSSNRKFRLVNETNGSSVEIEGDSNTNGGFILFVNSEITCNFATNPFKSSKKTYIWLSPGWNEFRIQHINRGTILFSFPFYYL